MTGEKKEKCLLLRTKAHVDHAGLSLQLKQSKQDGQLNMGLLLIYQNRNMQTAQEDSTTLAAQEVGISGLGTIIFQNQDLLQKVSMFTMQMITLAKLTTMSDILLFLAIAESPQAPMLFRMQFFLNQFLQLLMPQTGHSIKEEFLTIVETQSIMQCLQLDLKLMILGS